MRILILTLGLLLACSAAAGVGQRNELTIAQWHPSSSSRPHAPAYNGVIRVYFTEKSPWGSTACRHDSADISQEDSHMVSSLLAAFMAGRKVSIEVNDTLPKINDVCKITAAFIGR